MISSLFAAGLIASSGMPSTLAYEANTKELFPPTIDGTKVKSDRMVNWPGEITITITKNELNEELCIPVWDYLQKIGLKYAGISDIKMIWVDPNPIFIYKQSDKLQTNPVSYDLITQLKKANENKFIITRFQAEIHFYDFPTDNDYVLDTPIKVTLNYNF